MMRMFRGGICLLLLLFALPAFPREPQRYLIVLSLHGELTDAAVAEAGGVVAERFWDHLVATLTPAAMATLQSNGAVRYIQPIGDTVDPPASDPRFENVSYPEGHKLTLEQQQDNWWSVETKRDVLDKPTSSVEEPPQEWLYGDSLGTQIVLVSRP